MSIRGVWQLSSVTLRFCKAGGSSAGVREYIGGELRGWAAAHGEVAVSVVHGAGRHPTATGAYRDGSAKVVDLRNRRAAEVAAVLAAMRDTATGRVRKFRHPVLSRVPSVQGVW